MSRILYHVTQREYRHRARTISRISDPPYLSICLQIEFPFP